MDTPPTVSEANRALRLEAVTAASDIRGALYRLHHFCSLRDIEIDAVTDTLLTNAWNALDRAVAASNDALDREAFRDGQ